MQKAKIAVFGISGKKHFVFLVHLFKIVEIYQEDKELIDLFYNKGKDLLEIKFKVKRSTQDILNEINFLEKEAKNRIRHTKIRSIFARSPKLFIKQDKVIDKASVMCKFQNMHNENIKLVRLIGLKHVDIFRYPHMEIIAKYCNEYQIAVEIISKANVLPDINVIKKFKGYVKITLRIVFESNNFGTDDILETLTIIKNRGVQLYVELNKYHDDYDKISQFCSKASIDVIIVFYEKKQYRRITSEIVLN